MSPGDERGLSLIEVLIGVTITVVLAGVMLQTIVLGLRTMDETNARVASSNDTQFVASYFTSDVASATGISTTGTRSHEAPSVSPSVTNTRVVSFWSLNTTSATTVQAGLTPGWNANSSRFRVVMADEPAAAAGAIGARIAASGEGTSSITHSVALAPAVFATIARRAITSIPAKTSPAGESQLTVARLEGIQENDRLLAHIAVSGGSTTSVVPPDTTWKLVESRNSGTTLQSVIFQKLSTGVEPAGGYTFRFKNAAGSTSVTREAVIGIAAYSGVNTTVCATADSGCGLNRTATDVNPCGGETPVLLLSWTDRHYDTSEDLDIEISYNSTKVDSETHLIRNRCETSTDSEMMGTPVASQTLATNLAAGAAYASCVSSLPTSATTSTSSATTTTTPPPNDRCSVLPVTVTMSMVEAPSVHKSGSRTFLVRASTRTDRPDT